MSPWLVLFIFIFAAFRLTRMIVHDKPGKLLRNPFTREFEEVGEDGELELRVEYKYEDGLGRTLGEMVHCYWCVSFLVSVVLYSLYYFVPNVGLTVIYILGVAGCAAFVETIILKLMD